MTMINQIGGAMKRRNAVLAMGVAAAVPLTTLAQASRPMKRIAFFNLAPALIDAPYLAAFHAGMVEQPAGGVRLCRRGA